MTARQWPRARKGDRVSIVSGRHRGYAGTVETDQLAEDDRPLVQPDNYARNHPAVRLARGSFRIRGVDIDLTPAQRTVMADWAKTGHYSSYLASARTRRSLTELGLARMTGTGFALTEQGRIWCARNFPDGKVK